MTIKKIIFGILLLMLIWQFACKNQNNDNTREVKKIIIYPQETAVQVAQKLQENQIITDTKSFLLWARISGYDKKIKSGRYLFNTHQKTFSILKSLSQGGENKALVTIPEGYNTRQIAELLNNEGICSQVLFIKACSDKTLLSSLNITNKNVEGYLFPDSYDFSLATDANIIIERMVKRFWQILIEIQNPKGKSQKYIDTILTIASLVEKEAKIDEERPIIASVFYNRLKYRMPLQSCATVQYILPNHKEVLSIEDTKIESPYNTYLHPGLPPTPICNPGKASLIAAIKPVQTKYLYFAVDKNGSHYFSKNFSEHQEFLRKKNNHK